MRLSWMKMKSATSPATNNIAVIQAGSAAVIRKPAVIASRSPRELTMVSPLYSAGFPPE